MVPVHILAHTLSPSSTSCHALKKKKKKKTCPSIIVVTVCVDPDLFLWKLCYSQGTQKVIGETEPKNHHEPFRYGWNTKYTPSSFSIENLVRIWHSKVAKTWSWVLPLWAQKSVPVTSETRLECMTTVSNRSGTNPFLFFIRKERTNMAAAWSAQSRNNNENETLKQTNKNTTFVWTIVE